MVDVIRVSFDRRDHIDQHSVDRITMNHITDREHSNKDVSRDKVKKVMKAINERKEPNGGEQEEQKTEEGEQKDGEENVEADESEKEANESYDVVF